MSDKGTQRIMLLERDVAVLTKQMKVLTETMSLKDKEIASLREEVYRLKEKLSVACKDENEETVVLDQDGLKDLRRELEKIRTSMMPALQVRLAKSPFK